MIYSLLLMIFWKFQKLTMKCKLQMKRSLYSCKIMHHVMKRQISLNYSKKIVMKWPSQSPELNSIENLWTDLKVRFRKQFIELFNHLSKSMKARYRYSKILQEIWYDQEVKLIEILLKSMLRTMKDGWIKY